MLQDMVNDNRPLPSVYLLTRICLEIFLQVLDSCLEELTLIFQCGIQAERFLFGSKFAYDPSKSIDPRFATDRGDRVMFRIRQRNTATTCVVGSRLSLYSLSFL